MRLNGDVEGLNDAPLSASNAEGVNVQDKKLVTCLKPFRQKTGLKGGFNDPVTVGTTCICIFD